MILLWYHGHVGGDNGKWSATGGARSLVGVSGSTDMRSHAGPAAEVTARSNHRVTEPIETNWALLDDGGHGGLGQSEGNGGEDNKGRDKPINENGSGGIEGALTTQRHKRLAAVMKDDRKLKAKSQTTTIVALHASSPPLEHAHCCHRVTHPIEAVVICLKPFDPRKKSFSIAR